MSMNLTVDTANDRIVHIEYVNEGSLPKSLAMDKFSLASVKRKQYSERLREFKLFMVTRRSIANPGETVKMLLELATPIAEYPSGTVIELWLTSSSDSIKTLDINIGRLADKVRSNSGNR